MSSINGFYKGEVAKRVVETVRSGGGIITSSDLASYRAKIRTPLSSSYRDYQVFGAPSSSSGGTTILQMLNILENYDLSGKERRSASTLHLFAELMRIAFYNRAKYLGDN